jgi:branched-chain amino acid aminotransferase
MNAMTTTQYYIRINRKNVEQPDAAVNIFDHGFLFGDSIYEVVRTLNHKPLAWLEHLSRLKNSASRLRLKMPWTDDDLTSELNTAINGVSWSGETYVRIVITRGVGEIDLAPDTCDSPSLIMIAKPIPVIPDEMYEKGLVLCVTEIRRNSRLAMDPGIKSGNYLNNVLAIIEAKEKGADDAVMLNEHGNVTECTTSNIFFVKDNKVTTPSLDCGILAGITRGILLNAVQKAGISLEEAEIRISDLAEADEIFMTGSIKGVMPVREITGLVDWNMGVGPMTRKIKSIYDEYIKKM